MIRAKFKQTIFGKVYQKGEAIELPNAEDFLNAGIAYYEPMKPVNKGDWPKKDKNSSWYTLSDGTRLQGKENATEGQAKIGYDVQEGLTKSQMLDLLK